MEANAAQLREALLYCKAQLIGEIGRLGGHNTEF